MLDKQMIHDLSGTEQRWHHTTQTGLLFKTYELFISGIFHVIFWDCSSLWATETMESETVDKGDGGDSNGLFIWNTFSNFHISFTSASKTPPTFENPKTPLF